MEKKITFSKSKNLKLNNLVSIIVNANTRVEYERSLKKLDNRIKVLGVNAIGPIIQYSSTKNSDKGCQKLELRLMRQVDRKVNILDKQFDVEASKRIMNCLYVRYIGSENKINYAYEKISLEAFENDIEITGAFYTIFVSREGSDLVADVFAIRK